MMITDGPHAGRRLAEIVHLLWYPGDPVPFPARRRDAGDIRKLEIPGADYIDSKFRQQCHGGRIERVARRDPDARPDAFTREDFHAAPQFLPLRLEWQT